MFRHVVVFRWQPTTTAADVAAIADGLRALPDVIPAIRRYDLGTDVGINEGNWDFVVVADFDSAAGYLEYRDDPRHRAVITERIRDHVAERASVQYELG